MPAKRRASRRSNDSDSDSDHALSRATAHFAEPVLLRGGGGGVVPVAAMVAPTTSDGVAGQTVALIMVSTRDINAAKLAAK